jgi:hypothetical protein
MLPLRRLTRQPTTAIDLSVPRPTLTIVGPARGSNRYLPVSLWCSFMDARAAEAERKAPRHRGRDAAFVKEGEFLRIDREDVLVELGAPDTVEFAVSFDRVGRLSFSRGPSRRTDRCTRPELIEKPLSERIRSRNSARVRSGCDLTKPSMWILTASFTLLRIPYRDCATRTFCPVAARCWRSLRTYSQLTPKRLASTRQLPSPRSSASKILTRRSSE